jgi:hypothetical protein
MFVVHANEVCIFTLSHSRGSLQTRLLWGTECWEIKFLSLKVCTMGQFNCKSH